jgi:hypothetical protein
MLCNERDEKVQDQIPTTYTEPWPFASRRAATLSLAPLQLAITVVRLWKR